MFIVSSKSGGTLETLSHFAYFWEKTGANGEQFVAITDPGSALEQLAKTRSMRVFAGEPTIGGRYSALSPFGIVPAALMGIDVERLLANGERMAEACRGDANPGLQLGLSSARAGAKGRDKVCIEETEGQLRALGRAADRRVHGQAGERAHPGARRELRKAPTGQGAEVDLADASAIGAEFFRWEFAVAVAGADPRRSTRSTSRTSRRRRTRRKRCSPRATIRSSSPRARSTSCSPRPSRRIYIAIQAFIDPMRERELQPLIDRAHETGCVVTHGLGPRYLHSTGQLHKGGPPTGLFVQVVDDTGEEIPIPGEDFGFGRLIRAQAEGDYRSLQERGRPIVRVRLEDL